MSLVGQENELVLGGRAAMHDGIPVIDYTSTYSIAKAIFRNQNYIIGQLTYFIIICHEHQNKLKYIL